MLTNVGNIPPMLTNDNNDNTCYKMVTNINKFYQILANDNDY